MDSADVHFRQCSHVCTALPPSLGRSVVASLTCCQTVAICDQPIWHRSCHRRSRSGLTVCHQFNAMPLLKWNWMKINCRVFWKVITYRPTMRAPTKSTWNERMNDTHPENFCVVLTQPLSSACFASHGIEVHYCIDSTFHTHYYYYYYVKLCSISGNG